MEKIPISQWSEDDRPREKMMLKGKGQLSKAELIAILIGSGNNDESAVELAKRILSSVDNNLAELSRLSISDLTKFKGIGPAKAISIVAALELGRRRRADDVLIDTTKISSSRMLTISCTPNSATNTTRNSGSSCSTGPTK